MIRERISTSGKIRPLEPSESLTACNWPSEMICVVTSETAKRYLEGQAVWDERYKKSAAKVRKERERNVRAAERESERLLGRVEGLLREQGQGDMSASDLRKGGETGKGSARRGDSGFSK